MSVSILAETRNIAASIKAGQPNDPELELLEMLPEGKEKDAAKIDYKLKKQRELVTFISGVLRQMHDSRMSVINNMR